MYSKVIKLASIVLLLVGAALTIVVLAGGVTTGVNENLVDPLLYWAYALVAVGVIGAAIVGPVINLIKDPKSMKKSLYTIIGAVIIIGLAYVFAPAKEAIGLVGAQPDHMTLKMTDTLLNLAYIALAGAIISIIVGVIINAVRR